GGGPSRTRYRCATMLGAPAVVVMDLATKLTTTATVPGQLPVSHLSWSPSGRSLLVSAGPGDGNAGWTLSMYTVQASALSGPAAVPVTGDNASASYYREGVYLPSGQLFVNLLCCTGTPVLPSSSFMLQVDSSGTVLHQVAPGFKDRDHTSLSA